MLSGVQQLFLNTFHWCVGCASTLGRTVCMFSLELCARIEDNGTSHPAVVNSLQRLRLLAPAGPATRSQRYSIGESLGWKSQLDAYILRTFSGTVLLDVRAA